MKYFTLLTLHFNEIECIHKTFAFLYEHNLCLTIQIETRLTVFKDVEIF